MSKTTLGRRDVFAGVAGVAALLAARGANAQPKPDKPADAQHHPAAHKSAASPPPPSPALAKILETTQACVRDGRVCLARCTDHLAAGAQGMAECQRSVMNMLAVTEAMSAVAGYRNANPKQIKALAAACAEFCRACAATCEPHKDHHRECKLCMESCMACAKACEGYSA
jgi:Cys-rich four helix bundle protein (predicted Tat secretion target)